MSVSASDRNCAPVRHKHADRATAAFFLSQWYMRHEVAFRISIFFSAATIAGAFGGLLARLINVSLCDF